MVQLLPAGKATVDAQGAMQVSTLLGTDCWNACPCWWQVLQRLRGKTPCCAEGIPHKQGEDPSNWFGMMQQQCGWA